ncbi:probable serine/threonine-protein kinase nek3 [Anneissia japonica]|uniref:probable serine/threonine-protein kinase nek3 n=1 Tax=Anneissia japonica TaxID=1529436 RepID=UPI001425B7AA|nr:probable serine/threonine-protein kinase nek3 [Anneissia japonica]
MANKFEKIRVIGSGSFGQAWLVCSKQSRRKYVVKEMQVGNMTEKERNQALNEVSILARLKHHHVIRYRHAYVLNNMLCIAMEYADGGDMGAIIYEAASVRSLLAERRILKWFVQICLALQYIHGLNILHRDLKPQNIFVKSDDVVKVGDFGIARILSSSDDHANTAIGTPYYLSPEICCRKSYNQKSDMWAAGCILYELATLVHPFDAADFSLLVVKILTARYKPLNRVYGPFLHDLVSVLLSVNPKGRPSAEEILHLPAVKPYLEKNPGCNMPPIHSLNTQSSVAMDSRRRQTVFFDSRKRSRSTVNNKLNSLSLRVNEEQDDVQYPTTTKDITTYSNHNRKEALVFNFSDSHMTSPDDKTSVDREASSVTSPVNGNERSSVSSVLDAADAQTSASRSRKYSVNQTMVHLGVTRGSRSDGKNALTPARSESVSYFNKVLHSVFKF